LYSYLDGNKSVAAIEAALDKVCDFLPDNVKSECVELVNTYTPILIHLVEADLPPKTICSALSLCLAKASVSEFKPKKIHVTPKKNMPTGVECDVCVYAITYVENEIGSNTSIAAIESALETVCNIFPASFRQECDDFVTQYTPLLVHLIASELPPKQICQELSLCVAKHRTMRQHVPTPHHHNKKMPEHHHFKNTKKMPTGVECELCVHIFNYVDSLIEGNKTVTSVEAALDKVCSFLPKSVVQQCDDLVNQYTPILIHLIVSDLPPKAICSAIGMCSANKLKGVPRHHPKVNNPFLRHHHYHNIIKSVPTTELRPGHRRRTQQQPSNAPVHTVVGSFKPNDLCSNGPQVWCLSRAKAMSCGTQAVRVCQKYYWI
jgi:saposin